MSREESTERTIAATYEPYPLDEPQLAAVAFLARYSGRTLDAYRHPLRNLFQWAADHDLAVLEATRAHLELYAPRWRNEDSQHRRSTGACRPRAGSTASHTSTGGSPPTRPSTPPPDRSPERAAWTGPGGTRSAAQPTCPGCRQCHADPWTHEHSRAAGELDMVGVQPNSSRRLSS